jgi:hypothetical protein
MRRLLTSKAGMSHVKTAVLVLVMAMVFSAVFLYTSIMTIVQASRDQTQRVLDDFVMHNSIEIFDRLKNGDDLSEELDELFYKSEIFSAFSLDISGDCLYAVSDQGGVEYGIAHPHVDYEVQNTLQLKAGYDLAIPIRFAGNHLFDLKIPVVVKSYYVLKYD